MTAIPVKRDLFTSSLFSSPNSKPEFEVELDVQQFAPNEIDVKVSGDDVVVNCLHESKVGQNMDKRELHRQYRLPLGVDPGTVKAQLNASGSRLTVTAAGNHSSPAPPPASTTFASSIIPVKHVPMKSSFPLTQKKQKFQVELDVHQFASHEIDVKVSGFDVIIHCLHDKDGVKREVRRQYRLPDGVSAASVKSNLSKNGILTVEADAGTEVSGTEVWALKCPALKIEYQFGGVTMRCSVFKQCFMPTISANTLLVEQTSLLKERNSGIFIGDLGN
uniref:SHSP domain-containing protein n=1 Tax=Globodera rostochiensis TaxID=31243 RepID=A0A914H0L1_GLORO